MSKSDTFQLLFWFLLLLLLLLLRNSYPCSEQHEHRECKRANCIPFIRLIRLLWRLEMQFYRLVKASNRIQGSFENANTEIEKINEAIRIGFFEVIIRLHLYSSILESHQCLLRISR